MQVDKITLRHAARQVVGEALEYFGIMPNDSIFCGFEDYLDVLLRWKRCINITGCRSLQDILQRQLIPSIAYVLNTHVRHARCILDLGSGAGFPGIVMSILCKDKRVFLVEAKQKKACFLKHARRVLKLDNVDVKNMRAEELVERHSLPKINVLTSRFIGGIDAVIEYSGHILSCGGHFLVGGLSEYEVGARIKSKRGFVYALVSREQHTPPGVSKPEVIEVWNKCFT